MRLQRCKKLRAWIKANVSTVKIISDEKIFTVDQVYNPRNDCLLGGSPEPVKRVFCTKHPAKAMVMEVVASDGKRCLPLNEL
uniref:Uncharacterized protein n=1 Tax=Lepeophtheirus salmonis TaxID=72036 RepID=A0A0K2V1Q3_LEPSM